MFLNTTTFFIEMIWYSLILISICAFLIANEISGNFRGPKPPFLVVRFKIGKHRYHFHHWIVCFLSIILILTISMIDFISIESFPAKVIMSFLFGYGVHGLFVQNAFKIKKYDMEHAIKEWYEKQINKYKLVGVKSPS